MATSTATTPQSYIESVESDKKDSFILLRKVVLDNLPKGFEETITYGMITFVVPKSIYPAGYHCDPKLSLPFISLAAQKNFIALYHMGLYADTSLYQWFIEEYPKHSKQKLDIGKSCIRFKKPEHIPFRLIGELCSKISPQDWIESYQKNIKK
jgi:hypothetical protein